MNPLIATLISFFFLSNKDLITQHQHKASLFRIDSFAQKYCKLHKKAYIATIFPIAADNDEKIKEIFEKYGKIQYSKKVFLYENGPVNFLMFLYHKHGAGQGYWLGSYYNNFKGARKSARYRFNSTNPLRLYVFVCDDLDTVRKCKKELRKYFNLGLESLHVNDTHEETVRIANVIFDDKMLEQMNTMKISNLFLNAQLDADKQ